MAETKKKKSFDEWYEETYGGSDSTEESEKETSLPDIAPPVQSGSNIFSDKKTKPIGSVDIAPGANGLEQLINQQQAAKDKEQKGFFNKGNAFSDGWQFGDIAKTRTATVADAIIGAAEGAGGLVEGVTDWLAYGVAQAGERIDPDAEWHKMLKEGAMQNTLGDASGVRELFGIDDYSLLGNKTRNVLQGLGQVITQTAAGAVGTPIASLAVTYLSSTGSGMGEAYLDGATDQEAAIYGLVSGAVNTLSEYLFSGLGRAAKAAGIGKGLGIDDAIAKKITQKIAKPLLRNGIQYVIKAGGEGLEEVVAGSAEAIAKKLIHEDEKTLRELLKDEKLLEQFVMGSLVSGVMQGGDLVSSTQSGTDMITGESLEDIKNAQNVVNTLAEEQIAAAEKDGKKLTPKQKADIKKDIEQALERGELNTEDIERIVGGEDYKNYKAEIERQEKIQNEKREILKTPVNKFTVEQQERLAELRAMKTDKGMVDALKARLDERVGKATSSGRLAESFENRARRGQAFQADLSKYKGKALETVKKAVESGVLNDTRRTHELVDLAAKIAEDKGIDIDFTNNQRLAESGFAINGKQVNGFINKNGITLNANSAKALNKVVGHEITHAFEGTELYESLRNAVTEYSKVKGEYDSRLKELTEMYKNVKDADVQKELVADLVGDYIFADEAFVRNLHAGDRNLFQKIFDEVKYLCKIATAGSEQARQLEEVKRVFEKVYREGQANAPTSGDGDVVELEGGTVTKNSLSTWTPETQDRVKQDLIKAGYSTDKVEAWIKDTNGVAAVIAANKDRLDFEAADNQVMLKDNQEYIKTLDASTLCAKRLIYQGTFDAIQHRLPNQMLSSDELIDLLNMMKKHKVQTPCGVCYVESRRRHLGKFAQDWLNGYNGAYKPNLDEVTTSDGLEKLRKTHPDTYKDFVDAMNKKGSSNPKVVQLRTEYRNEIMSLTPAQISKIEAIGGLRVQSFSDFETPHMLDMMQAVMDMSAKKLHSQAYTKVPNFAWIFGDTGIKINLSLIAEGDGFDADGRLVFSSTEGMDFDEAMLLRDAYSANVGTIIVGANDKHILACMADDRIDFIIPFHRSGWGSKELHLMGMDSYTDYTYGQKEHDLATGKGLSNLYPPDYWDYNLTGKENAERYLKLCAQTGREPKFSKFLVDNGDGSYSLQPDGSTDGYWKMLIDFKMYDNNGVGAPQQIVQPTFNMDQAYRVLEEYEGGANELPVANEVVDEFVAKYRAKDIAPTAYSLSPDTSQGVDRISLENIAPASEQIAVAKRVTEPTKKVDTLPMREDVAPVKKVPKKAEPKVAQVLTEESGGKKKGFDAWAAAKNLVLDKGMVFEDLALKTKNRTLQARWNSIRYANSKAQQMIGNGYGKAKALTEIRKEVEQSGKTEEFYNYLYHKHNVDRMSLETNKTARSLGMKNKPVFGDDVTAKDSARIVAEYEKSNPEFKAWAKDVYDYMNTLREMLVTDGVISRETANLWAELYPSYVPIRRAGKEGLAVNVPLDTRRTGVNAPIKSAKGGNSNIEPLFGTMALRTEQTYRAIARNRFGIELRKTLGSELESSVQGVDETIDSIDDNDSLLKEGKNGRLPTFTVFENGKKVTFEITDEMYNAMKPTSEVLRYRNKVLNLGTSIFRSLVTEYNPIFMIKNPIKDAQDVLLNSQHPAKTYATIPKAVTEMAKNGEYYRECLANGGEQNTYFESDSKTFTKENEGFKKWIGMPFRAISWANGIIERIPRLAEYIASREAGRDIDVSMLDAARVTTNFAAGGDLTKALNRNGFTFLNASVQGAMQNVRNVREAKANGLKGWVQLAAKVTAAGLPALLLNALVWDDDEEYEELSDYVKQNYYIVAKFGDGTFVRIPKGRTVAVIQDAFEQMKNLVTGDDEVDMQTFFELVVSNLAPNNPLENNVIAPIQQALTNKTWYGDDLVPTRLQDLPAAEQYDESIDVISKWLGETTNTSPYKWNYVLDQYSGVIGDIALPMLTPASDGGGFRAPFADAFTTDSTMKNQNISDFYDTVDELNTKAKGKNATDADVLRYKFISSANSELSDLYKAKRFIQNSNMTDEEKDDAVRKLQRVIDDLAKESLDSYKNVRIDGNRAAVGDKQYKYEKGEWKKITDDKQEKRDRVVNYLNTLDVDYGEKLIIYRSIYKNDNAYNKEIVEYVRNRNDLTYDEMVAIFESLGFTVKNGRVYWN